MSEECVYLLTRIQQLEHKLALTLELVAELEKYDIRQSWSNAPDKDGYYWMSPLVEGKYHTPILKRVVDYDDLPRRGREVYEDTFNSYPVMEYLAYHYPKSKWMYIPTPPRYEQGE